MKGIIYKITNKLNGKSYIGQTVQKPILRWRAHCSRNTDSAIHLAINKYGKENFTFDVICSANSIEDLNALEIDFIRNLNTFAPNGYNLDEGGRNCLKSKESIEKGAIKKRGMAYKNRRRGIVAVCSTTKQVIETEVVKEFLNYGFSKNDLSNIRWCLTGKSTKKRVKGYFFFYKDNVNQNLIDGIKNPSAVQRIANETVEYTEYK